MTQSARPIFIIGALRSSTSMLTWSLGQHPNIRPMLDNRWLEPFAAGLQESYRVAVRKRSVSQLDIMGVEIEDFAEHFGEAVNQLLLSEPRPDPGTSDESTAPAPRLAATTGAPLRWVDGSPGHGFNVAGLHRMFPRAKFIHVLRDVDAVVAALTDESRRLSYRSHWRTFTEAAAYAHWLEAVEACIAAERAYGSDTILRIRRDDLIEDSEATIRRCLDFLDEAFEPACVWPFA